MKTTKQQKKIQIIFIRYFIADIIIHIDYTLLYIRTLILIYNNMTTNMRRQKIPLTVNTSSLEDINKGLYN